MTPKQLNKDIEILSNSCQCLISRTITNTQRHTHSSKKSLSHHLTKSNKFHNKSNGKWHHFSFSLLLSSSLLFSSFSSFLIIFLPFNMFRGSHSIRWYSVDHNASDDAMDREWCVGSGRDWWWRRRLRQKWLEQATPWWFDGRYPS